MVMIRRNLLIICTLVSVVVLTASVLGRLRFASAALAVVANSKSPTTAPVEQEFLLEFTVFNRTANPIPILGGNFG